MKVGYEVPTSMVWLFAVTVSAFLVGIVLGSAVVRRAPHLATGRVPASTILAGATLALAIAGYLLSTATGLRQVLLAVFGSTWTGTVLAEMTTAVLLVLPAAASTSLVFCALAPRVVRALSSESHDLSIALLANLVGSALAPLVSGLVAMPLDGARGAVRGAVIALGLAAAWLGGGRGTSAMLLLISFGCAIALPPQLHRWAMGSNQEVVEARGMLDRLPELGISIDEVTQQLEDEGVGKFSQSFDKLMEALKKAVEKRGAYPA